MDTTTVTEDTSMTDEQIVQTLSDDDLATLQHDRNADFDLRLEAASEIGLRRARQRDAAHEAFHGRPIRRVTVGRRPGYRGESVCADCYYGKAWNG